MPFLVTRFLYPISGRFTLSSSPPIYLANPETAEDEERLLSLLVRAFSPGKLLRLDAVADANSVLLDHPVDELFKRLGLPPAPTTLSGTSRVLLKRLVPLYVLAYYDGSEWDPLPVKRKKPIPLEVTEFEDPDSPYERNARCAENLSALLTLLALDYSGYYGTQLFYGEDIHYSPDRVESQLASDLLLSVYRLEHPEFGNHAGDNDDEVFNFRLMSERLGANAAAFRALSASDRERLLYAGRLLWQASNGAGDERLRLLLVVGVLELLLTRNPKNDRFNVEDSISKQFQLKVGVAHRLAHPHQSMTGLSKALNDLYKTRSLIAHGNFAALERWERLSDDHYALSNSLTRAYSFARSVVKLALSDPALLAYLKEG
jgi:hypothetical protein